MQWHCFWIRKKSRSRRIVDFFRQAGISGRKVGFMLFLTWCSSIFYDVTVKDFLHPSWHQIVLKQHRPHIQFNSLLSWVTLVILERKPSRTLRVNPMSTTCFALHASASIWQPGRVRPWHDRAGQEAAESMKRRQKAGSGAVPQGTSWCSCLPPDVSADTDRCRDSLPSPRWQPPHPRGPFSPHRFPSHRERDGTGGETRRGNITPVASDECHRVVADTTAATGTPSSNRIKKGDETLS